MADNKYYHGEITSDSTDWGIGDETTENKPCGGDAVQGYIKRKFSEKAGDFYYDTANNRYMVFADENARNLYLSDPQSHSDLLLGTFDAPFNYTAEIHVEQSYISALSGTTGIYVRYTFDIKNKQGASVGDNVNVTYTFNNAGVRKITRASYAAGTTVEFLIDDYIGTGQNIVTIGIVGQTTLAATTQLVTVNLIDLHLTSTFDFSKLYNAGSTLVIPVTVKGDYVKAVDFFIDGSKVSSASISGLSRYEETRTALIPLTIGSGVHTLQIQAWVNINGTIFHSKTLYYQFYILGNNQSYVIFAAELPVDKIVGAEEQLVINGTQYEDLSVQWAYASAYGDETTRTTVTFQTLEHETTSYIAMSETIYEWTYMPTVYTESGTSNINIYAGNDTFTLALIIARSDLGIEETTQDLLVRLTSNGRSNSEVDRDKWYYNNVNYATFTNFDFNLQSGWDGKACLVRKGSSVLIDVRPFNNLTPSARQRRGVTIDIDFSVDNVDDDNAVIISCWDTSNNLTRGFQITSSSATMRTEQNKVIETMYKPRDRQRICLTLHRSNNDTEDYNRMTIVNNGILERAVDVGVLDTIETASKITIGSLAADVKIYSIRVYSNDLTVEQCFGNWAIGSDDKRKIANENDVLDGNEISYDKIRGMIPTFVFTGDMIKILEAQSKKDFAIMDVDYHNPLDPSKDFIATNAYVCPQGTSSLGYPIKNLRLYTNKSDSPAKCIMTKRDENRTVIQDGLYAFKDGALPVDCWTLKTDYAESSMSHNTGTAKLWNNLAKNVEIGGVKVCKTAAQKWAEDNNYPYDVRVSIDGFPCCVFYHLTENAPLTFMGQFNFDNDKSTEGVFGYTALQADESTFDNQYVECWECLENENTLALFTNVSDFASRWSSAFESRYPDTKTPNTTHLQAFCEWINSMNGSPTAFATQKWEHLDVYKMSVYYIYAMRHGAVDQLVKNTMLTTEGYGSYRPVTENNVTTIQWVTDNIAKKYYYTWYDNDTIHGIDNKSFLVLSPLINRESRHPMLPTDYAYAGHESVLWNMLEDDEEFMSIVEEMDKALYAAGLTYSECIRMYDAEQSAKWPARIYNASGRYKYITNVDYLHMLQGARTSHRHWWLKTRFDYFDSLYVSGAYYNQAIYITIPTGGATEGTFKIVAGDRLRYGYRVNNELGQISEEKNAGEEIVFTPNRAFALGDPVYFLGSSHIQSLDISDYAQYLYFMDLSKVYTEEGGCRLKRLILGHSTNINIGYDNLNVSGVPTLETLGIRNMQGMTSIAGLKTLTQLKNFDAVGSGLTSFQPADGVYLEEVILPDTIQAISISEAKIGTLNYTPNATLTNLTLLNCSKLNQQSNYDEKEILDDWLEVIPEGGFSTRTLMLYGIDWSNVDGDWLCDLKEAGWREEGFELRGRIQVSLDSTETLLRLVRDFGENSFSPNSALFIQVEAQVVVSYSDSVVEGMSTTLHAMKFPIDESPGTWRWTLLDPIRTGNELSATDVATVNLITQENNSIYNNVTQNIRVVYTPVDGDPINKTIGITIVKATYPSASEITLVETKPSDTEHDYTLVITNTSYTGHIVTVWDLTGDITQYASLEESSDGMSAVLTCHTIPSGYVTGTVSCKVYRSNGTTLIKTNTIETSFSSADIAFTSIDNAPLMALMNSTYHRDGSSLLAAHSDYMTIQECQQVYDEDLVKTTGTTYNKSIFYSNTAFRQNCTSFDELRFFTSLTMISEYMLYNCRQIKSITLPPQITSIGQYAFYYLSALESINIPSGVTSIGQYAFWECSKLTSIVIPEGVTRISTSTFEGCNKLASVVIPSTVTSIGEHAFGSAGLESLTLPNGVTTISRYAFEGNDFTSLVLPPNITSIGEYAFYACQQLETIEMRCVPSSLGGSIFSGCYALTSVTLPSGLTAITDYMFASCTSLATITIPESVTSIGNYAFQLSGLTTITIPSLVTSIGTGAFSRAPLASISVSDGNTKYDSRNDCNAVLETSTNKLIVGTSSTVIPSGVTSFESYSFSGKAIQSLTIPSSVTNIGNYAFSYSSLVSITIPNTVTTLGTNVFEYCTALTSVTLSTSLTTIPSYTFFRSGLTTYTVPSHITTIGNRAFDTCASLVSVTIPSSVTTIGEYCFYNCQALERVELSQGLLVISYQAFYQCYALGTTYDIVIPSTVTTFGSAAFNDIGGNTAHLRATTPPTATNKTFTRRGGGTFTLYIPVGTTSSYQSATNYGANYTYVEESV